MIAFVLSPFTYHLSLLEHYGFVPARRVSTGSGRDRVRGGVTTRSRPLPVLTRLAGTKP